ncbi:MAG: 50S ribosomal protein L23, partial [Candidatus Fonsibacter lacus]|nr:50S ribosomal protein L23 [Candidatus Fonsibacter lacus]
KVAPYATKANIKKSIEKLFKVNVIKVNTINLHPRFKMVRGRVAKSSGYKKAIVTLKKGQSIDITTGI